MKKAFYLILFLSWIFLLPAQQTFQIQGRVIDASTSEELIGVTIIEKGTNRGASTGIEGDFSLSVEQGAVLVASYVGYETQEITITSSNFLTIMLQADNQLIDELVVVGYTVQKRRDILGAVSKVNSEELTKIPVPTLTEALQGRVAGVNVTTQTGEPGSNISVRIRGVNSIFANNEPLYIVDGVQLVGGLNSISPNDIESITVLKDASYAAIYGSRAANGVVLVTTKTGAIGQGKVSYNMQIGFQKNLSITEMVNTSQYIELYNEAARADNANSTIQRPLIEGDYLREFANVNHLKEIFRTAMIQSHEISFSGGSEKTQYLMSVSYFDQDGIILNTDYNRFNVRSNIRSHVKDWLQVGFNANVSSSNQRRVSSSGDGAEGEGGSVIRYAYFRNPAIPVRNSSGDYVDLPSNYYGNSVYNTFFGDGYNPVALANNTDMTYKEKSLLMAGDVLITLPYNFFIKSTVGLDYTDNLARIFNTSWGDDNRINNPNSLNIDNNKKTGITANATLNHSFSILNDHSFNWFVGSEIVQENESVLGGSESGFDELKYLGLGNTLKNPYQAEYDYRLLSFFGTLNYNYNQKYYVSLLLRTDGSSRFVQGNRWGVFYAASAGWNIESENFMQSATVVDKLKLRVGYGSIGNQDLNGYYPTVSYYKNDNYYYAFGDKSNEGYILTDLGNTELKWETNNQFNAGIDLELWKSTFGVTVDYFHKTTHDMLVIASYPPSAGNAIAPYINNGSVLNTGVDIELFYRKNYRNGGFNIGLNGGYLKNKVLKMEGVLLGGRIDSGVYATRTEEGHPIGSFFLYEMDGIFQDEYEIRTSAYQGSDIQPGDVKYKDQNGDGIIDANDRVFMGSAIPKFTTGLNLSGYYKNFDLSIFFQGAFGQKIYYQVGHDIEGFYRGFGVTKRYYDERWTGPGTSNTQPRASWSAKQNNAKAGSSRFLHDGSYFRLKNIQLGYTIPNTKRIYIDNIRVYVSATNLFTLTKYIGNDPEMTVSTNSLREGDIANGIDWGTYPTAASFTFGLNITF